MPAAHAPENHGLCKLPYVLSGCLLPSGYSCPLLRNVMAACATGAALPAGLASAADVWLDSWLMLRRS